jgi:hypothetical protein
MAALGMKALRLLALLLALCLLLEASARVHLYGLAGLDPRRVGILKDVGTWDVIEVSENPWISYEYKPNQDLFLRLVRFRTNSHRMRDKEYPVEKPAGTVRVAVIGSSFTLPLGVEIEDAFHSVLEDRWSSEFAPTRYEFLNFATAAYVPSQMLATLLEKGLAYDPDLILFCLSPLSTPLLLTQWNKLRSPRLPVFIRSKNVRSVFLLVFRGRTGPRRQGELRLDYPEDALETGNVISKLGEIRRETGIPVVIMRLSLNPIERFPVEIDVEQRARSEGLLYLDTRSAFRGMNPTDFWIHEFDPHPNAQAHAIFADVLDDLLRTHRLLAE